MILFKLEYKISNISPLHPLVEGTRLLNGSVVMVSENGFLEICSS
jgi:hypothetical protein